MRFFTAFLFTIIVSCLKLSAQAPVNDECSGALTVIPGIGSSFGAPVQANNTGATESRYGCAGRSEDDVWFTFKAGSARQVITVSTSENISPVIEVFNADCQYPKSLVCYSLNTGADYNTITLDTNIFVRNTTYTYRVYGLGYSNARCDITTSIASPVPIPPANDECSGAIQLPVSTDNSFANGYSGRADFATQSMPACSSGGSNTIQDVWFSFTATAASHNISVAPVSGANFVFEVFSGSCNNLVSLGCYSRSTNNWADTSRGIVKNLVPGNTYYMRLYDYFTSGNTRIAYKIFVNTPGANDCMGAFLIVPGTESYCNSSVKITSTGAGTTIPACYGNAEDNIWLKFTATSNTHRIYATTSTNLNPVMEVFSGGCGNLVSMGCFYNSSATPYADISAEVTGLVPGQTYYYRVYGAGSNDSITSITTCIATPALALPGCVTNVSSPADGSKDVPYLGTLITFKAVPLAASYDLYMWTGNTPSTTPKINIYQPSSLSASFSSGIGGNLLPNTTYSWYLLPKNNVGTNTSCTTTVRSFTTAPAPPSNDECAGAFNIPVNANSSSTLSLTATLDYATQSQNTSCITTGATIKDVWFKFTATAAAQRITVNATPITSSINDPVIEAYSGNCESLNRIACANNAGSYVPEAVILNNLIPGNSYYVRVYDYNSPTAGEKQTFTITANEAPVLIDNDKCSGAYTVVAGQPLSSLWGTVVSATNAGATQTMPGCYGIAEDDIWFKFTANSYRHRIEVSTVTAINPVIEVFSGSCAALTSLKCSYNTNDDHSVSADIANFVPGQVYYYRVYGMADNSVRTPMTTFVRSLPAAPVNDDCQGAINLPVNSSSSTALNYTGSIGYASQGNAASCDASAYNAKDVWYKFIATATSHNIKVSPIIYPGYHPDYLFQVFSGNCANLNSLICVNTAAEGIADSTTLNNLIPGNTYYIRVWDLIGNTSPDLYFNIVVNKGLSQTRGSGLRGDYYSSTSFYTYLLTRVDTTIDFEFTSSKQPVVLSPAPGIVPEDRYSVRWTGKIQAQYSETYTFYTISDDGIRLKVNGQMLIDNWTNQGAVSEKSGSIALLAGQQYDITIEYFEQSGDAITKLLWSSASTVKQIVPKSQLFPPAVLAPPSCTVNSSPENGAVISSATSAVLLWNTSADAEGYKVFVWKGGNSTNTALATVTGGTYTVTGLLPSTTYNWLVVPFNPAGEPSGCATNITSFTTPGTTAPASNGNGLQGKYFNGTTLSGAPLLTRIDTSINYELSYSKQPVVLSPAPGIVPEDGYSVRWTGKVQAQYSETYTFYTVADDGIRLWVNGQLLVDNWINQGATEKSGSIALQAGQQYDIIIEYYENTGEAVTKLLWSSPSTPKAIVPKSQLYTPTVTAVPSCTLNNLPANGSVTGGSASASLSWNSIPEADGYKIFVWQGSSVPGTALATVTNNSYTLTGLLPSTVYRWYIVPFNAAGDASGCSSNSSSFTTASTTIPAGNGTGLRGVYFNGTSLSGTPLLTRTDPTINFELSYSKQPVVLSPAPGIVPEDGYSVRWTGKVQAQFSETYTFYTVADDGIRLWVNGQLLVDNWINQGPTEKSGTIALTAGQQYNIVIEYYENTGEAVTKLFWSSPSTAKQIVPKSQLYVPILTAPPSCTLNTLPVNATIINTSTSAFLSWNRIPEAEGYRLYGWLDNPFNVVSLATVSTNNYTLTGLDGSTMYYWYVVPFNAAGDATGCSNNTSSFITTREDPPGGNGSGLQGMYFNGTGLSGTPLLTRIDSTINFTLSYSNQPVVLSPAPGIVPEDLYSVRWTGQVQPLYSETYTFYTVADDGVRLWVNGQLLVDNWVNQGATEKSGSIALLAGQKYDIVIEYYESGGEAVTKLLWSTASTAKQIVPSSQLYPPAAGARIMSSNLPVIAASTTPSTPAVSASLSPNPVSPGNLAKLQISSNKAGTGIISVSSSNGRMVSTEKIKLVTGINSTTINTRGLAQGLYIITVTGGSKPINLKLLVE